MKFEDIKLRDRVYDRMYPQRRGIVVEKLKTRIKIDMIMGVEQVRVTYDKAHCRFLEKTYR